LFSLFLAGCSGKAPAVQKGEGVTVATDSAVSDRSAIFGDKAIFKDGVEISVNAPSLVTAGQYASGAVEGKIAIFEVTVTNGSSSEVDGALMSWPEITYGASGKKAGKATDLVEKIGLEFFSTILPGEKQTIKVGAGIPPAEIGTARIEVKGPSFSDKPAIFKAS